MIDNEMPDAMPAREPLTGHLPPWFGLSSVRSAPSWDVARRLRTLAGVDESVLVHVPQERPRYTSLGGVVLGTAMFATLSMFQAAGEIAGGLRWWCLVPALAWGVFVCNLDRWLVTSAMGTRWRSKAAVLIPRLLLAVVFGIVIAEPMVLRIFDAAIVQQIRDARSNDLENYRSQLVTCNPAPGSPEATRAAVTSPACAPYRITASGALAGKVAQLAEWRTEKSAIDPGITADTDTLNRLNETARLECNGTTGPGLTGKVGVGPNCGRDRAEADAFRATSNLPARVLDQSRLASEITGLEGELGNTTTDFTKDRNVQIERMVAERQRHQQEIGFLERVEALSALSAAHPVVGVTSWFVRLFLIVVDCLPVLVKLLSGTTRYERLIDARLATSERNFQRILGVEEHEAEQRSRSDRDEIDLKHRRRSARRDAESLAEVDRLTERLLSQRRMAS
jgi:hypothetical protein